MRLDPNQDEVVVWVFEWHRWTRAAQAATPLPIWFALRTRDEWEGDAAVREAFDDDHQAHARRRHDEFLALLADMEANGARANVGRVQ